MHYLTRMYFIEQLYGKPAPRKEYSLYKKAIRCIYANLVQGKVIKQAYKLLNILKFPSMYIKFQCKILSIKTSKKTTQNEQIISGNYNTRSVLNNRCPKTCINPIYSGVK